MSKCIKCDVDVNSVNNRCPLCNSELKKWKKEDSVYPNRVHVLTHALFKKIVLLIAIICSVCAIVLNYYLTPSIKWSLFVVLQIIISCILFSKIMVGKNRVLKSLFIFNFLVCGLSIFWDFYVGFKGWSLDYVLPSLCIIYCIFAFILRVVNYFVFKETSSYIYFNIMLGFAPLILLYFDYVKFSLLAYMSGIIAFINLIILIIFDWSDLKTFISKKLHI